MGAASVPKPNTVGTSSRTPGKHELIRAVIGQMLGACGNIYLCDKHFVVIDMCSGDGQPAPESNTSSPQIIRHHFEHPRGGRRLIGMGGSCTAHLYESKPETFRRLQADYGAVPGFYLYNESSDGIDLNMLTHPNSPSVLIADPNNINDMPLPEYFYYRRIPVWMSIIFTLGCNVGGLKRLEHSKRLAFAEFGNTPNVARNHHDVLIFWLDRDAAQWAYMLVIPLKWTHEIMEYAGKALRKGWDKGITATSYKCSPSHEWDHAIRRIYLTNAELSQHDPRR